MNIVAFHGSPRKNSNSSYLLKEFLKGAAHRQGHSHEVFADRSNLAHCRGCLRCNLIKRCAIKGDGWEALRVKIIDADALVFASPVYFHHLSAPLKNILDRFRSFMHVRITGQSIIHTTWQEWKKRFILLLAQGSPDAEEAKPIIDLFTFLTRALGPANSLHTLVGTRLAVQGQVVMSREELRTLYGKLELPARLADIDYDRNQALLQACSALGRSLTEKQDA